ncbi:MAG TPA: PAC2 family protein [Dehalococcoidia bacterium]
MALVGAFELDEPVPALEGPRLLVSLRPWVDVGSVGTLTLSILADRWGATEVGRLVRPGRFYDFTRYRPVISTQDGERRVTVPNTFLQAARAGGDWLLLHALEPHANGEDFCDAVVALIRHFGVREYLLIGSMYGPVPHTRDALVSGGAAGEGLAERFRRLGVRQSTYQGPTTILATIPEQLRSLGIATGSMLVQLPAYAQLETDYRGAYTLLDRLRALYGADLDLEELRQEAERQYSALDSALERNPQLRSSVRELEELYDRVAASERPEEEEPRLSPELERFLAELERRFDQPDAGQG